MTELAYYFNNQLSPTQLNLQYHLRQRGHLASASCSNVLFSDRNLSLDENHTQWLEYKHRLATLLSDSPQAKLPLTFIINDDDYQQVIDRLAKIEKYHQTVWILKPALLNNGQGIRLFQDLKSVVRFFHQTDRYAGPYVLQRYIDMPHCLNGHKYSFRLFVVITNFSGAFLYQHGYFNISSQPYNSTDFTTLSPHLTNEHLSLNSKANVYQVPTTRCSHFNRVFGTMRQAIYHCLEAYQKKTSSLYSMSLSLGAFSIFGFDFVLDNQLNPWLLEVNHCPCFPTDRAHPLQHHLYDGFWSDMIDSFVIPMTALDESHIGVSDNFIHL